MLQSQDSSAGGHASCVTSFAHLPPLPTMFFMHYYGNGFLFFCLHNCFIWDVNTLLLSVGLRQFCQAPLFAQSHRTLTPLKYPSCSKLTSRGGSHIMLQIILQQKPQASGEMIFSTSTIMCTLKNWQNNKQRRREPMTVLIHSTCSAAKN